MNFTRMDLEAVGFEGFETVAALQVSTQSLPRGGGVYVVLAPSAGAGHFLAVSAGGWFKGRDPSVPVPTLRGRWHASTPVLYIGKATSLRSRLGQLVRFGAGRPVAHWGGRYLWQVKGSGSFLIAWREGSDPRGTEIELLRAFASQYGSQPFANIAAQRAA